MAEELLNGADVLAILEQMSREAVPKGVARGALQNPGSLDGRGDGALDPRFVEVVTPPLAGPSTAVDPGRREQPLPGELTTRIRELIGHRMREFHEAGPSLEILAMEGAKSLELFANGSLRSLRQERRTVSASFRIADVDPVPLKIDIFDAESGAFHQTQPCAVEEKRHESGDAIQLANDPANFIPTQDYGQASATFGPLNIVQPGKFDIQHPPIEKEYGRQGLILG